jgi:hypothetical protein
MGVVRPTPPALPPLQILQHPFPQHLVRPRYVRPSSLTNAQVLKRSLALNHERVAWQRQQGTGRLAHSHLSSFVLPLSLSLWTFAIPAAAGTLLLAFMGYSLEADHGHMASNETITSKPFISPPTNDLPVASPIPVTDLKSQSPGHEQALASRVFHLNHNVIGQPNPRLAHRAGHTIMTST